MKPLTVLIVDDHAILRDGLRSLLDRQPGITVIGEAGNGQEFLDLVRTVHTDIVLMDIEKPQFPVRRSKFYKLDLSEPTADAYMADILKREECDTFVHLAFLQHPVLQTTYAHELEAIEPRPFVSVDLEGGVVNRMAGLWGELPAPSLAALAGRRAVRALGEASGAACRALGVHLDLAPVVDLDINPTSPAIGLPSTHSTIPPPASNCWILANTLEEITSTSGMTR